MATERCSAEYHSAHLAFARAEIVAAAANRKPILDLLVAYTNDVAQAERDRLSIEVEGLPTGRTTR